MPQWVVLALDWLLLRDGKPFGKLHISVEQPFPNAPTSFLNATTVSVLCILLLVLVFSPIPKALACSAGDSSHSSAQPVSSSRPFSVCSETR